MIRLPTLSLWISKAILLTVPIAGNRTFSSLKHQHEMNDVMLPKFTFFHIIILILILGDENTHFYDEQKTIIPNGKCLKQVGTYQYEAKNGVMKTVPAVEIK